MFTRSTHLNSFRNLKTSNATGLKEGQWKHWGQRDILIENRVEKEEIWYKYTEHTAARQMVQKLLKYRGIKEQTNSQEN